jgi:rhamnosyltransferase
VGAVVVAYQAPDAELEALLSCIAAEVSTAAVVLNQALPEEKRELQAIYPQLHWQRNSRNLGLAAAQNQGINVLIDQVDAILLLDQDSLPDAGTIPALAEILADLQAAGEPVAGVAPAYRQGKSAHWPGFVRISRWGFSRVRPTPAQVAIPIDFAIASGKLMPVSALRAVGLMDESLFIDHIDTEWCLRAAALGYCLYGTEQAAFSHSLGEQRYTFWLGRQRQVSTHAPWRYYMMFRNSVLLYARRTLPARWKQGDALRLLQIFLFVALCGPHRWAALRMMVKGVAHGLKGCAGPPPLELTTNRQ